MNSVPLQLVCIQFVLLMMLILSSHENRIMIQELREIKVEISK